MPVPKGTRFRFRTLPDGRRQRLAFLGNDVIEVKMFPRKRRRRKRLNVG